MLMGYKRPGVLNAITAKPFKPPFVHYPPWRVVKPRYFENDDQWIDYYLRLASKLDWKLI